MTASDFKGMAHVVVIERTDGCNRVVEFEGDVAMEDAHLFAQRAAFGFKTHKVLVTLRIRTISRPNTPTPKRN